MFLTFWPYVLIWFVLIKKRVVQLLLKVLFIYRFTRIW